MAHGEDGGSTVSPSGITSFVLYTKWVLPSGITSFIHILHICIQTDLYVLHIILGK